MKVKESPERDKVVGATLSMEVAEKPETESETIPQTKTSTSVEEEDVNTSWESAEKGKEAE